MGQDEQRELERVRKAEYRERKRLEQLDAGKPWLGLMGEEREQAIRNHFGYGPSEKRTQEERNALASRIMAGKTGPPSMPGFSAKKNDLSPSPAQLKKLGGLWPGR